MFLLMVFVSFRQIRRDKRKTPLSHASLLGQKRNASAVPPGLTHPSAPTLRVRSYAGPGNGGPLRLAYFIQRALKRPFAPRFPYRHSTTGSSLHRYHGGYLPFLIGLWAYFSTPNHCCQQFFQKSPASVNSSPDAGGLFLSFRSGIESTLRKGVLEHVLRLTGGSQITAPPADRASCPRRHTPARRLLPSHRLPSWRKRTGSGKGHRRPEIFLCHYGHLTPEMSM